MAINIFKKIKKKKKKKKPVWYLPTGKIYAPTVDHLDLAARLALVFGQPGGENVNSYKVRKFVVCDCSCCHWHWRRTRVSPGPGDMNLSQLRTAPGYHLLNLNSNYLLDWVQLRKTAHLLPPSAIRQRVVGS